MLLALVTQNPRCSSHLKGHRRKRLLLRLSAVTVQLCMTVCHTLFAIKNPTEFGVGYQSMNEGGYLKIDRSLKSYEYADDVIL
jgi:hypothetical protein